VTGHRSVPAADRSDLPVGTDPRCGSQDQRRSGRATIRAHPASRRRRLRQTGRASAGHESRTRYSQPPTAWPSRVWSACRVGLYARTAWATWARSHIKRTPKRREGCTDLPSGTTDKAMRGRSASTRPHFNRIGCTMRTSPLVTHLGVDSSTRPLHGDPHHGLEWGVGRRWMNTGLDTDQALRAALVCQAVNAHADGCEIDPGPLSEAGMTSQATP
jgi:hypothetical protein